MANWEALTGQGAAWGEVFTPIAGIANSLNSILTPIQTILGILRSVLKIIRVFLLDATSLVLAVIKTLVKQITDFIRNLGNSGIFFLLVSPDSSVVPDLLNGMRGGFDAFVEKIVASLDDSLDPLRPLFPSSQKVGGVAYGISTGNIMDSLNFISFFLSVFQTSFTRMYPNPTITGASGNSVNIIEFNRPSTPTNFFTGLKVILERATESGGVVKTKTGEKSATNQAQGGTLTETDRDSQTGQPKTTWKEICTIKYDVLDNVGGTTVQETIPERFIFIDQNGEEGKAPHLIRFDISKQADSQGFVAINQTGDAFTSAGTNKGPTFFTIFNTLLGDQPQILPTLATKSEITSAIPESQQSDFFKSKYLPLTTGEIVYLDFRVNGLPIPHATTKKPSDEIYIQSATHSTVTLSKAVPVGSTVEVYAYVMASSGDILLQREFNAGHNTVLDSINRVGYTYIQKITKEGLENGKPYYYRLRVESVGGDPSTNGTISNEIRLVPRQAYAPTIASAFCLSEKEGPFVIKSDNNILNFKVGNKSYQVSLPLSKQNIFATSDEEFGNSFGLLQSPNFDYQNSNTIDTARLASDKLERRLTTGRGLTFYYVDGVGRKQLVMPSQFIPVDIDEVVAEITNQINDRSVIVKSYKNRILIQDNSNSNSGSSIEFVQDCGALGFSKGMCMNVQKPVPPNWSRVAIKDIIPQIGTLADFIDAFVSGVLSSAESPIKALVDFIDLLDAKIVSIQKFIQKIQDLLALLASFKIQLPNIYKLEIPACNGTDAMKSYIENAGRPLSSANDFAVGIVLVVGGVGADTTIDVLHKLL